MTDDDDLDLLDPAVPAIAVLERRPSRVGIGQPGQDRTRTPRRGGSCRAPDNTVDPAGLLGFLTHRDAQRRHRRRTLAVGTATAVLAGAAVFWIGVEPFGPSTPSPRPPVAAPIETWSDRAQVTLVSISSQLDQIDQTTQVWNTRIVDQYQGMPTPAPVVAMLARKGLLERQRAILTSELATAHELDQARAELAELDQQITTLNTAAAGPTPSNTAAGQGDVAGLGDARALAEQMRAAKQAEVDRLTAGMRRAEQTPMPDRIDQTTPLTQAVLSLDTRRHPDPSHPGIPGQTPPGVAPGGPDGRRAAQQVTTGQPVPPRSEPLPVDPSTRGPDGNPSTGIGRAVTTTAAGAVRTVDNTAQKILTPGGGHTDNGATDAGHRGKSMNTTSDGAVGGATHTVTGAVGALGDTAEHLITPSGNPRDSRNHQGGDRSGGTTPTGARTAGADRTVGSAASAATHTVTGTVDTVGGAAQKVLNGTGRSTGSTGSTGSGTATGRHRAAPTGGSAASRAAQLQYAAQIVTSVPGSTWASGTIAMAQQLATDTGSTDTGSSGTGSASVTTTPRSGGGSYSARTSTLSATSGSGGGWGSSWSAHPTTSATGSTSSGSSRSSTSSSERTSSSSSSSADNTGSAPGSGGASSESSSSSSSSGSGSGSGSGDGGGSSW